MTIASYIRQIFALATILCAPAAWAVQNIVVTDADGAKATFSLADSPKVTFTTDALVITAGSQVVEYPATGQIKFEFDNAGGIADASRWPVFAIADGQVQASGLEPSSAVKAYTIDGRIAASTQADANGCASIDLTNARGVIVINTSSHTFKISK